MRVSISELTKAVQKVKSFAETIKQAPGIMFDINGDTMSVCYSDGKKSIIEKLGVLGDEGDVQGRIVVGYNRFLNIIDICQSSGGINTEDIDISFLDGNIMNIEVVKTMSVQRATGNTTEDGEPEYVEESKVVSKFSQKINYERPSDNLRYGILDRMDYEKIFEDNGDVCDIWDTAELKKILSKTSNEKGKTVYLSSKVEAGFVVNLSHVVVIPTDSCVSSGFSVSTSVAKSLMDILSKIDDDQVRVIRQDRYVSIINGTDTVGIWFEIAPVSKTDLSTLEQYRDKAYDTFEMVFSRAALSNVVNCASANTKEEKTYLTFNEIDGYKSLIISSSNSASYSGDFYVVIEGNQEEIKNWEQLSVAKLPVSLRVLKAMIDDCDSVYISMDIMYNEQGCYMRLAEALGRDEDGRIKLGATHYTVSSK